MGYDTDVMTPGEVAKLCRVDPKTVNQWSRDGRIPFFCTLGGHRRYRRLDVEAFERRRRRDQRLGVW